MGLTFNSGKNYLNHQIEHYQSFHERPLRTHQTLSPASILILRTLGYDVRKTTNIQPRTIR